MCLSTNLNPTQNAATGSRQLMFSVASRQASYDDEAYAGQGMVIVPELLKHRNDIWSELVSDLVSVVESMNCDRSQYRTGFRMADFGTFMLICADNEGWYDEAKAMLKQMAGMQTAQVGERNLFIRVLSEYLLAIKSAEGQYKTVREWAAELIDQIPGADFDARKKMNANYIRYMLKGAERVILDTRFIVEEGTRENGKWNSHLCVNTFAFTLKDRSAIDSAKVAPAVAPAAPPSIVDIPKAKVVVKVELRKPAPAPKFVVKDADDE